MFCTIFKYIFSLALFFGLMMMGTVSFAKGNEGVLLHCESKSPQDRAWVKATGLRVENQNGLFRLLLKSEGIPQFCRGQKEQDEGSQEFGSLIIDFQSGTQLAVLSSAPETSVIIIRPCDCKRQADFWLNLMKLYTKKWGVVINWDDKKTILIGPNTLETYEEKDLSVNAKVSVLRDHSGKILELKFSVAL